MGLSSILSHSSNPRGAALEPCRRPASTSGWYEDSRAAQGVVHSCTPDDQEWQPTELVRHVASVHHPSIRQSMADLSSLVAKMSTASALRHASWEHVFEHFVRLRVDVLAGIQFEESELFPQFMLWPNAFQKPSSLSELRASVKAVERLYAHCLQMIWRLLRLTRDEMIGQAGDRLGRQFCDQLVTVCGDYEQHLLEVDCLLLPGIAPREAECKTTSAGPRPCPVATVILASCDHHFRSVQRS